MKNAECKMMNAESSRATWAGAERFCILHSSFCIRRSSAFTLIEMLVSLAVLSLALAIVGYVFTVTTKTASQATAYSQTDAWVREFARQIEEDLSYCDPAQSLLVMVGRTQSAALTQNDLDAGKRYRVLLGNPAAASGYDPEYDPGDPNVVSNGTYSNPRADLLMFFSNRPTASMAPNPSIASPSADPYANGVKFSPIRVVYGHAALGKPIWNGANYQFPIPPADPLSHIEQTKDGLNVPTSISKIPAVQWQLSRVGTIIDPNVTVGTTTFSFDACQHVLGGQPYPETTGSFPRPMPGDAAQLDMSYLLRSFGPNYFGTNDAPTLRPYNFPSGGGYPPWQMVNVQSVNSLLYSSGPVDPPGPFHHVATVLDEVPVDLKSNLAVHLLPGCVWFQVEFLMPEDPRNSSTYFANLNNVIGNPNPSLRSDMPRWMQVPPGQTYVFAPDTQANRDAIAAQVPNVNASDRIWDFGRLDQNFGLHYAQNSALNQRIIRLWPYAIRVTVRVWDPRGQLPEPIVRTVVHRFE